MKKSFRMTVRMKNACVAATKIFFFLAWKYVFKMILCVLSMPRIYADMYENKVGISKIYLYFYTFYILIIIYMYVCVLLLLDDLMCINIYNVVYFFILALAIYQ